jgi:hypothetical protein
MLHDADTVRRQLGRPPRQPWRVEKRCSFGFPTVIATPSRLVTGELFPTTFYLTCPHLVAAASTLESAGEAERWASRLAAEPTLAARMLAADAAYRAARVRESGGADACPDVGIAGQRDPLATKCLHAHVAAALSGIDDPVGKSVLEAIELECCDARCGSREEA